ncbi:stage II sporulation protein D [Paenibacillus sp. VCA1]|uniref:stage II sporulation protein D n=1 Tax=Paenibacillus sp. VCA1 TaxID=3039148 RepID=UPI002871710D|nr:stage II sporulation protein D [Paenibacillus sp. VCA1]MDR9853401.1 stage II sporulation protein D [Paenibacillus sp. VCA1]
MKDPRTQIKVAVVPIHEAAEADIPINQTDVNAESGRGHGPAAGARAGAGAKPAPGRQHLRVLTAPPAQPPQAAAPTAPEPREALRQEPGAPAGARQDPGRRPWAPPPARGRGSAWRPRGPGSARRLRPAAMWAGGLLTLALLIPALVVTTHHKPEPAPAPIPAPVAPAVPQQTAQPQVSVYLSKTGQVEKLPLEEYVVGVVAAEMPAKFDLEALKAQAVAARTFIVRRLADGDQSGVPGSQANVTDTVNHQAYISKAELEAKWKEKPEELAKLRRAVEESRNTIMTYNGKPITASFFSTGNGYTENSEDYWNQSIPYLRSVSSPWDEQAPGYKETVTMSIKDFLTKLGLVGKAIPAMATEEQQPFIQILAKTAGHRIKEISIGGETFTGREVREKLGLRSSEFSWQTSGSDVLITTYGYGHGVGMSQWGAEGMAKEGYTATQILKHYYTGVQFSKASDFVK